MVVAFLVGATLTIVLAVLVTALLTRRRAARPLQARLEALLGELTGVRVSAARLEERLAGALADAERLRRIQDDLQAALTRTEQEKARLDYELRQVGLVASRVPQLERQLADRDRLEGELVEARNRIADLEPLAEELELRNQFIETLQRELSYRDERSIALERRVGQLAGVVQALEAAEDAAHGAEDEVSGARPVAGRTWPGVADPRSPGHASPTREAPVAG